MKAGYVTFDKIDVNSGAGLVCHHETRALAAACTTHGPNSLTILSQPDISVSMQHYGYNPFLCDYFAASKIDEMDFLHLSCSPGMAILNKARPSKYVVNIVAHDLQESIAEHEKYYGAGSYPFKHNTDPYLHSMLLEHAKGADMILCPSHSAEKWIINNIRYENICVIPHGTEIPDTVVNLPDEFLVGYLGAYGPDKGLIYLAQALGKTNVKSIWAGSCSDSVKKLWGVPTLGWVNHVSTFYNQISAYIQPSCFLPGTPVVTERGINNIEDTSDKVNVITMDGEGNKLIRCLNREYSGEIIQLKTMGSEEIGVTLEHPFCVIKRGIKTREDIFNVKLENYSKAIELHKNGLGSRRIARNLGIKESMVAGWIYYGTKPEGKKDKFNIIQAIKNSPEWIMAKEIEVGDILLIPRIKQENKVDTIVYSEARSKSNHSTHVPSIIKLNRSFLRLLGYYISEGCSADSLAFCFNINEKLYIEETVGSLKILGLSTRIAKQGNKATVWADCKEASLLFASLCGKGAHNKKLPYFALNLPKEDLSMIIQGIWRGDGSLFKNKNGFLRSVFSTVSKSLAYGVYLSLIKVGYQPHLNKEAIGYSVNLTQDIEKFTREILNLPVIEETKRKKNLHRTWIDENFFYVPVTSIKKMFYRGKVFNLSVDNNQTYCVPFVVHNCTEGFGIEILEAMAHGRPVIVSNGAGGADVVTNNVDGLIVPPRDIDALASAIQHLSVNPQKVFEMGQAARATAKKYSWDKIEAIYVEMYRKVINES